MKNGLFKKSMSVFLSILMLLTCWVWVAPTEAGAIMDNSSKAADKYGTPYWTATDSNTRWMRWGTAADSSNDHLYIKVPKTIYMDVSETLQSAGYVITYSWHFGDSTSYRIGISSPVWGENSSYTGQDSTYFYTMTNAFNNFTADASMHGSNAYGVNGYSNANQYDIRVFDTYNGYKSIGLKNLKGTLYSGTIYYVGTPKGTYSGRYSTYGSNPSYFGYGQKWSITKWNEHSNYTSMMKAKPTAVSEQHSGYNEVFWDVEIYDKAPLKTAIDTANSLVNDTKYTLSSRNALKAVVNTHSGKLTTRELTNAQIDAAVKAINDQIAKLELRLIFDNLFNFGTFTIDESSLTLNERTDDGFTVTSKSGTDANTGFSYEMPVEPGKTYVFSADVEFTQTSGGYDMYIHTLDANKAGETTATPDTSNGAHREGNVYISLTGQTTNKTPYIRFTAGENTKYIRIRFDANATGNKLKVSNIKVMPDGVSYIAPKTYTKGQALGSSLSVPTRTGYTFNGWYLADGTQFAEANGTVVSSLQSFAMDNNYTLISKWTVNQYTITFDTDGGSTIAPITQNYGTAVTAPANPTKTNYKFVGWDQEIPATMPAKNMTITAKWVEDSFKIKFVNHDGTVLQESNVVNGQMPAYTGATPTKAYDETNHYTFSGWSPAVSAVTGEATYTAQFTATAHTIKYENYNNAAHKAYCDCGYFELLEHKKVKRVTNIGTPATCNQPGSQDFVYDCSVCDAQNLPGGTETIPATGEHTYGAWTSDDEQNHKKSCTCGDTITEAHTWTGWVAVSSNTNTAAGQMKNTCSTCGYELTTTCNYSVKDDVPSTCYSQGYTTYKCTDCGHGYTVTKALAAHTPAAAVTEKFNDSTCYAEGSYDSVVYCSVAACKHEISRTTETIEKKAHTAGEAVVENEVDSTCYATGSYDSVVYCSVAACKHEISRTPVTIEKKAHTPAAAVEENKTDSTCYATGSYDSVVYCSVAECHAELSRTTETIEKKEHTPAAAVEENKTDSTCYATGSYESVVYCSVAECHAELSRTTETIEKKEHTPAAAVRENEVAPTCITDGSYDSVVYCSVAACKHEISRTPTVDRATGNHIYGAWTPAGERSHTHVCTADEKCTASETEDHNWDGWVADSEKDDSMKNTCRDCGYVWTASCEYKVEEDVDSTCYSKGHTTYKCKDCNNGYTVMKDLAEHTAGEAVVENKVDSSCYATGSYDEVVYCSVCAAAGKTEELSRVAKTIEKKAHTAGTAVVENKVDSSCYAEGSYDEVVYCSVCAAAGITHQISRVAKTIEKKAHTAGDAVVENTVDSTCYAEGSYDSVVYCSIENCHAKISSTTVTIEKKAHTAGEAVTEKYNDSTCYAEGSYDSVVYCSVTACKHEISRTTETIEKKAHTAGDAVVENKVDSSCYAEGSYDEVVYCSVCAAADITHQISRVAKTIAKKEHTAGEAVVENKVDSSCYAEGSYDEVVYCSVCAAADITHQISRETKTIEKKAHTAGTAVVENKVDSSCYAEGSYDEVVYCSVCAAADITHQISRVAKTIEKKAHTAGSAVVENEVAATCTAEGSYDEVVYCSVCAAADVKTEMSRTAKTIEKKAHTSGEPVVENKVAAGCTVDGSYDNVTYCTVCGTETSRSSETIPALGHTAGAAVVENKVEATCTVDGSYDSVTYCTACGTETSRSSATISAPGHTLTQVAAKAPTCSEVGYEAYEYCSACDYTTYSEIPALGHKDGTPVIENKVEADCVNNGSYDVVTYCTVCKSVTASETIIVEGLGGHKWSEGSCTEAKTCSVCGETDGTAPGHSFGAAPIKIIPATCKYERAYVYKCRYCDETKTEGGEEHEGGLAHTGAIVPAGDVVEPTCETDGFYSYICMDCGVVVQTEKIEKLGHADADGNGECDNCKGSYQGNTVCGCICHKQSGIMKFLYKIALFFWKLFGIGKSCGCGTIHY